METNIVKEKETSLQNESNINQNSRRWSGIFLLAVGGVLLANKLGAPIPHWLMSWQIFVIALGLLIGVRHQFRNPSWIVLVGLGSAWLLDDYYPELSLRNYIWPVILIVIGISFIMNPKRANWITGGNWRRRLQPKQNNWYGGPHATGDDIADTTEERVDITAFFGGVKKRIFSKNFRGGDITAFMGGVEIDLAQADIQGGARLDMSAVFGGIKLIVPADWEVRNEATAVFGGIEDKRTTPAIFNSRKLLILDGVAVFGGIELKSF